MKEMVTYDKTIGNNFRRGRVTGRLGSTGKLLKILKQRGK